MFFREIKLKNSTYSLTSEQISLIGIWLNEFISAEIPISVEKILKIYLVEERDYLGQVSFEKIEEGIIELNLEIKAFRDMLEPCKDIGEEILKEFRLYRNNLVLHELIHIENYYKYGFGNKICTLENINQCKEDLIEMIINEYLAVYISQKKYPTIVNLPTEDEWVLKRDKIISEEAMSIWDKIKKIAYNTAHIVAVHNMNIDSSDIPLLNRFDLFIQDDRVSVEERYMVSNISRSMYGWYNEIDKCKKMLRCGISQLIEIYIASIKKEVK